MREKKNTKTEVDLSKPLNLDDFTLNESDCFGNEWKPDSTECSLCADIEVCGTLYRNLHIKKKIQKVKENQGINFLDEVNFKRVPWERLYNEIKSDPGKLTTEQIYNWVKQRSKSDDHESIIQNIKNFKMEYKVTFKSGLAYAD